MAASSGMHRITEIDLHETFGLHLAILIQSGMSDRRYVDGGAYSPLHNSCPDDPVWEV